MNFKTLHQNRKSKAMSSNGFSMVEVLIAGILLASSAAAVSRLSVSALAGSAKISERTKIEAAINDNIQTMQMEDSYFTNQWIGDNFTCDWMSKAMEESGADSDEGQTGASANCMDDNPNIINACLDPPRALKVYLISKVPKLRITGVKREFDSTSIPGILKVTYRFDGPEQQIQDEQRVIEMSPNFAAQCYTTQ